jgi:hypothetical protein
VLERPDKIFVGLILSLVIALSIGLPLGFMVAVALGWLS